MMIFIVLPDETKPTLIDAMKLSYPNNYLELGPNQWLIANRGTAKDVSDTLKITGGENGNALVATMSGYFGRASPNVWDWIKAKLETP